MKPKDKWKLIIAVGAETFSFFFIDSPEIRFDSDNNCKWFETTDEKEISFTGDYILIEL